MTQNMIQNQALSEEFDRQVHQERPVSVMNPSVICVTRVREVRCNGGPATLSYPQDRAYRLSAKCVGAT